MLAGFGLASLGLQGVQMVAGLLTLRWMRPDQVGLWQSLILIQTYTQILQGGVLNGLNRELPFTLGKGDLPDARALAGTAQAVALGVAAIVALLAPAGWILIRAGDGRLCLVSIAFGTAMAMYRQYLAGTYRAEREFSKLAVIYGVEAVLAFLTLPIVYTFALRGFAARFAILAAAGVALNHVWRPLRKVGRFNLGILRRLLTTGIPIFAFGYVVSVAETFPRLHLLAWKGKEAVGLFAPAGAAYMMVGAVCGSLAQYVYPQMSYRLGSSGDPRTVWRVAAFTALGVMAAAALPVSLLAAAAPWLLDSFFPAYSVAAGSMRWMAVSSLFLGMGAALNALLSLKAWRWMTIFAATKLALYGLLPGGLLRASGSMTYLALGIAITEAVLFTLGLVAIDRASRGKPVMGESRA